MSIKKFFTTVKIAILHTGEPEHVLHTAAQNLASSAESLKEGLKGIVAAHCVPKPDDKNALEKLLAAVGADVKDEKVYQLAVKKAKAVYDAVQEERGIVDRLIDTALDNAKRVLHESNCITDMGTPEVTPDMHEEIVSHGESVANEINEKK